MTNKRNRNKAKTGQNPPTPAPAKKKIDRSSSPSSSVCSQENSYLITCMNCKQMYTYTLTNDLNNSNHCFGQIFVHKNSASFTCNLDFSFNEPTDSCPYLTPKHTIDTSMKMINANPVSSLSSNNTISPQTIPPTSTTQNPFFVEYNVTQHAALNVTPNLNTNTNDLITNTNKTILCVKDVLSLQDN